jgi:hypothetical protein
MIYYNKGDILVCSRTTTNVTYDLIVGDKYEVIINNGSFRYSPDDFSNIFLDVRNIKTGKDHKLIPDKLFITLEVYREFKLREILKDESS